MLIGYIVQALCKCRELFLAIMFSLLAVDDSLYDLFTKLLYCFIDNHLREK